MLKVWIILFKKIFLTPYGCLKFSEKSIPVLIIYPRRKLRKQKKKLIKIKNNGSWILRTVFCKNLGRASMQKAIPICIITGNDNRWRNRLFEWFYVQLWDFFFFEGVWILSEVLNLKNLSIVKIDLDAIREHFKIFLMKLFFIRSY